MLTPVSASIAARSSLSNSGDERLPSPIALLRPSSGAYSALLSHCFSAVLNHRVIVRLAAVLNFAAALARKRARYFLLTPVHLPSLAVLNFAAALVERRPTIATFCLLRSTNLLGGA